MRDDGVALARIGERIEGQPPRLTLCHFASLDGTAAEPLLQQLVREHQLGESRCVSVVARNSFSLLLVESPQVEAAELKAAVRWRIKDLIDFHIDDAIIDLFDIPGQQERGRQRMMYVVAARTSDVERHITELETPGVALDVIDIPELALRNIAQLLPEDRGGVATLYIGRHNGMLVLTRNGTLYLSRRLDTGLEQLKAHAAQQDEEEFLLEGEEPAMAAPLQRTLDNVVLEIQRSLDYYESHFSLPPATSLVIAPMEEGVAGMMGYLGAHLGVPVRMLDLGSLLECSEPLSEPLQSQCLFAIGAALREEKRVL